MRCRLLILTLLTWTMSLTAAEPQSRPSSPPKSDWTVRDHIPIKQFIMQSHRGAGELAPENTLEAFELGWKLGTWPEADVRTTKDGVIVAFHDNTFERVVRKIPPEMAKKGVKDITFEQLSKLDVGAWKGDNFSGRRVAKINDVFAIMKSKPERHLYLDIKNVDLKQLAKDAKQYGVESQVALASTKYEIIREWKSLVPNTMTLLWMGGTEQELRKRIEDLRKTDFADVTHLQIHVRLKEGASPDDADPFTPSSAFLVEVGREVRPRKIVYQTLPWGATEQKIYWKLLDLGVMSFATDHPEVTLEAVRKYYAGENAR